MHLYHIIALPTYRDRQVFKQMDANSSGAIDIAELEAQIENVKAFNATFVDPIVLLFNAIDLVSLAAAALDVVALAHYGAILHVC